MEYVKTHGGIYVDLKLAKDEMNLYTEILLNKIPLRKDDYNNNDILDGTQWRLEIHFLKHNKIKKWGSNEYPAYWREF